MAPSSTAFCEPGLSDAQIATLHDLGYLVLDRFLDPEVNQRLKGEIDIHVDGKSNAWPCELPEHGRLISDPRLMALLDSVLGSGFGFHHLHSSRHDAGAEGVSWHHDYEQIPQTNRSHTMVHVFFYLNGLDGTIGDLMLLPKSHNLVWDRYSLHPLFGTSDLPGSVVINDLAPGTAVIVNSALLHARRAKPGGEGKPRYFIDTSYCQAGIRWPSYGRPEWREILGRCRALGLDRGLYPDLFAERHFFDQLGAWQRLKDLNHGSLVTQPDGAN
ncbi:MAG: phytanoyl-CoA dioxygenase family protein [Planctomycetes bacterium]|nr:phytanoyl-CoA dioxygenase family protein [Planctomycetota bacterium]